MPSAFFLAQTAAEFSYPLPDQAQVAWMACYFSPYSTGLSNLPSQLPEGSMLIVNDLIPVAEHDPDHIIDQLRHTIDALGCSRLLLDFQRPGEPRTKQIVKAILDGIDCPVGVSPWYAEEWDCPVFLPPLPLCTSLADHLAPWQGRSIWLELMPEQAHFTITEAGCQRSPCSHFPPLPHFDQLTYSRYGIRVQEDAIQFTIRRGWEELAQLRLREEISCYIALYQSFAQPEAQATAFAQ